jgi:adenine-specific DNA-methyltransferase
MKPLSKKEISSKTAKLAQTVDNSYIPRDYPLAIKYMGSKAKILDFIGSGLREIHDHDLPIVDLFSGACSISGGFGGKFQIISNDIQSYSEVIACCYLKRAKNIGKVDILSLARPLVEEKISELPKSIFYPSKCSLKKFNEIEERNRNLIKKDFSFKYHLYTKNYSGTWWSAEQCVWIDTIREALDDLYGAKKITKADFYMGLTCLMHAMAYSGQGTGHYAQYRDAKTMSSMVDINSYRQKSLELLFEKKLKSMFEWNISNVIDLKHKTYTKDYQKCLEKIPKSVVYADPPYAFVHYSRFYHAIETLCKYDFPNLQVKGGDIVKGRYREERHQSPFCIRTQVEQAFSDLFLGTKDSKSHLILSYSNSGMISLEHLVDLAVQDFGRSYDIWCEDINYQHRTMGRKADHSRDVLETLIIARKK